MMPNRYHFSEAEPRLARQWADAALYAFDAGASGPIYTIDTPPPTVSGTLHIGHCYSYTQTDVIARFHRMSGERVLYPMGFDDNGLPTERFVEKTIGRKATEMDRQDFITHCLQLIEQTENRFESLWRRLGLSVDWNYRYSTISPQMQRVSQWSFIQLYQSGLAYTQVAPTLWCPECQTAIAQAEVDDRTLPAQFSTLAFRLQDGGILSQETIEHSIGTHERCGTPVEYLHTRQWFVRVLEQKERLLEAGRQILWHPEHMLRRYEHWVENLNWDWCISRQRFLGVPFPAWTCTACGEMLLARLEQLPIDPRTTSPSQSCACGSSNFEPEPDVMDTWATSSCTPLMIAHWPDDPAWFAQHFPASLRPQAHDIIRTWAFYSIVKSLYHTGDIPWRAVMISGHALSAGRSKISKSKDHQEAGPMELIEQESADALRYWATSIKTGSDTPFNPETIATGRKLMTKLWNASRFAEGRLEGLASEFIAREALAAALLPTDRWLLSRLARVTAYTTSELQNGEYATGRSEVERFFWSDLCDNYLELAKARLYRETGPEKAAAQWTLYYALLTILKLLAPYLPYITEEIYQHIFRRRDGAASIHRSSWPSAPAEWLDARAEETGKTLLELLHQVRRYKAEHGLSVGAELASLHIHVRPDKHRALQAVMIDLKSATRAQNITLEEHPSEGGENIIQVQTR